MQSKCRSDDECEDDYDFGYIAIIDKQNKFEHRFDENERKYNKYWQITTCAQSSHVQHSTEERVIWTQSMPELNVRSNHDINGCAQQMPTQMDFLNHLKLKRCADSHQTNKQEVKKKKLMLPFNVTSNMNIAYIAIKLLRFYKYIEDSKLPLSTPIDLNNDYSCAPKINSKCYQNKKAKLYGCVEQRKVCNLNDRLSSRTLINENGIKHNGNDMYETLFQLLPESLKTPPISNCKPNTVTAVTQYNANGCDLLKPITDAEFINSYIDKINTFYSAKRLIVILDLMEIYLTEISNCKAMIVPKTFIELYTIYRNHKRLPFALLCVIETDITIDQIWLCLTANEINFDQSETVFLSQMMIPIKTVLSEGKYLEFLIRFSLVMVNNENNRDFLKLALNLLSKNNMQVMASNNTIINYSVFKSILDSQTSENKSKMIKVENFELLIENLESKPESELTSEESTLLNEAIVKTKNWQKGIDIMSSRNILDEHCLLTIKHCLESGKRSRISYQLSVKLAKLAIENDSVYPWICLYWGIIAEEYQTNLTSYSIIDYLTFAHQYLGKKGMCTSLDGEFLLLALQVFLKFDMKHEIINCFNCLYNFIPTKKLSKKHEMDESIHCSPRIALKWKHCETLFGFLIPKELPAYDDRARYIHDIESLFLQIIQLVPKHLQPNEDLVPIINYIDNNGPKIGDKPSSVEVTFVTQTIYYLMGDYYFQKKMHDKACEYYANHLRLQPLHFDSWAASALCRNYKVDELLQIRGISSGKHYYQLTFATIRCYSRALQLKPTDTQLWIEFGQFTYNTSSNASPNRNTHLVGAQPKNRLNDMMMKIAASCFESALKTDSKKERWLSYYMLGKIEEKTGHLLDAIKYYEWADIALHANGASYPNKILYSTPPYLSVEALEIHYRIHAISLKSLCNPNDTHSLDTLSELKVHLIRALRSPFTKQLKKSKAKLKSSATKKTLIDVNINDSVSELMTDILDAICETNGSKNNVNYLRQQLITLCLNAMKRCLSRYAIHYKSIYRLAYYYFTVKDYKTAKLLLLNSQKNANKTNVPLLSIDICDTESAQQHIIGLFGKRNATNFFREVLSIPIQDIDRPGSFFHHMYRSVFLLIKVCTRTQDYEMLCTITIYLSRKPPTGKWYLKDRDRLYMQRFCFDSCLHVLKTLLNQTDVTNRHLIIDDLFKIKDRFCKSNIYTKEIDKCIDDILAH